jgi:hypothetical protein
MTPAGFPHSDIPGSKLVCSSPRLIAAYHVLHRLLVPRHPPCALSSLTGISKVHSLCLPSVSYSVVKERSRHSCRVRLRSSANSYTVERYMRPHEIVDPADPLSFLVEIAGLEPAASGLQSRRSPS